MADYYDRAGNPMELLDWAAKFEDMDYKRVAFDKVGDHEVSTVWLGVDHGFGAFEHRPLIFETMVFGSPADEDNEQERYSTEADALAGHTRHVERLRELAGRSS